MKWLGESIERSMGPGCRWGLWFWCITLGAALLMLEMAIKYGKENKAKDTFKYKQMLLAVFLPNSRRLLVAPH